MKEPNLQNSEPTTDLFTKILDQEKMSQAFGFYWSSIDQILEQIKSECDETQEAYLKKDRNHLQEEIGDILQSAVCLAIFCKIDPFEALNTAIEKYQTRFDLVKSLVEKDNLDNLKGKSMEFLLGYWDKAKRLLQETKI